jgi:CheY-like chemotaxis protein
LPSGGGEALTGADAAPKETQSEQASLEGLQILIADDETDALDLITVELAQHGAKVTAVTNAEDALKALEQGRFDVLISDIGMPKIDGYELIRQIRKREQVKTAHSRRSVDRVARVEDPPVQAIGRLTALHCQPVDARSWLRS